MWDVYVTTEIQFIGRMYNAGSAACHLAYVQPLFP